MTEEKSTSRWESILPRFSLNRRITVLVLMATALVVGLVAAAGIPLELFPRGFNPPFMGVNVPWQDAPPQEVLDKIVLPLEEELSTVRGLEKTNSFAVNGFGRVGMQFKHGTDMDVAYREVRDRVQRARARMPDDADRIYIRKHDDAAFPVAMVGLAVDPELIGSYDLIQKEIVLPLERIDGVASVDTQGLEEKEILIEVDRSRTEGAGLNIYQLAQDLGGDNFSLASGTVLSGDKKLLLRSVARYGDLEALENRLVAPSVRLKDIATVKYEEPEKRYRVRVNSRPAIAVQVLKEGDANTLEVTREVRKMVERMQENPRLSGIEMTVFFDQGEVILESIGTLLNSGKIGVWFAIGVLFFFLRRFRMTLIITLSIPLSLIIALTVMYFAGETLNILSLLGLMICVGLLVDNSVVVAENIYRLHRGGASRRDACIKGAGEIALAIVMATLTTVAVFLPVSLVEGQGQFFLLRMSIPISVSLIGSLFVALIFVPLSVYLTLPAAGNGKKGIFRSGHEKVNTVFRHGYEASFGRLNQAYGRLLGFFLRRRFDLVMALLAVMVVTGVAAKERVKIVEEDADAVPFFELDIEVPDTYTFAETEQYFLDVERVLEENQDKWGLEGYFYFHRAVWGEVQGWFPNPPTTDYTTREVVDMVLEAIPERPGVEIHTGRESETEEKKLGLHTLTLNGDDATILEEVEDELEVVFAHVDGVIGIKKSGQQQQAPNELGLKIDRDRAQRQQVNPEVIAGVVGYALRGQALPKYYSNGREIPVRVRFEERDRESLDDLKNFAVPTENGQFVSLASLTDVEHLSSTKLIRRLDKRLARSITVELEEGREEETRGRLIALAAGIDLPEGVSFGAGHQRNQQNEDVEGMKFAAAVSVLFIYLLMGFLFESFILPLSILLTIPLASFGVIWLHIFTGRNIDFLGTIGLILLIGVVVNNGIVLIDYVNRLRKEGHPRTEALLLAATRRFRPIMMTALTTIFGMVPLILMGTSSIGLSYTSFGYTLIGGLASATLLTMLVVPVFYTLFEDLRDSVLGAARRVWRGRKGSAEAVPAESV